MRFARALVGMLLLTIGIPALLAGAALGIAARRADPADGFTARIGAIDLQAWRAAGWLPVAVWMPIALGGLLVVSAALLLRRPARPREVVFVVDPDQVPVLADRLGVTSLTALGTGPAPALAVPVERPLVAVGRPDSRPRRALGPAPARRPATLADLGRPARPAPPAWPPLAPEATARPLRIEPRRIRPAAPGGARARQRS
ncbi:hypothetical protein [Micromonospora sp. RTGN7]|uniref:hypothetical protein n=1 Tax=Micromonospora sp. RTGN7 TaxID=3016526 RepID=UPI0029FEEF11|nr:hypothetical protein [Micromonospora sp. RTGN7]